MKAVYRGKRVMSPQLARRLALTKMPVSNDSIFTQLSEKEEKILQEVIRGMPVFEIAKKLNISQKRCIVIANVFLKNYKSKGMWR